MLETAFEQTINDNYTNEEFGGSEIYVNKHDKDVVIPDWMIEFRPRFDSPIYRYYARRELVNALDFGRRFANDTKRLVAIMENVIKNRGEFKP